MIHSVTFNCENQRFYLGFNEGGVRPFQIYFNFFDDEIPMTLLCVYLHYTDGYLLDKYFTFDVEGVLNPNTMTLDVNEFDFVEAVDLARISLTS